MSRSRRKTPVFGNASAQSEREGKKIWHSRMRAKSRTALSSATDLETVLPVLENEAGNVWSMEKDGKNYVYPSRIERWADNAAQKGRSSKEKAVLRVRKLKKIWGK